MSIIIRAVLAYLNNNIPLTRLILGNWCGCWKKHKVSFVEALQHAALEA